MAKETELKYVCSLCGALSATKEQKEMTLDEFNETGHIHKFFKPKDEHKS